MPNPASLISCFPPIDLNEFLNQQNPKRIYLYIDLKNVLTSLFVEDIVQEIVTNSQTMRNVDSSIFQSVINFISLWRQFAYYRNLDIKIFFCTDIGKSCYHRTIDKSYKQSREIINSTSIIYDHKIKEIRDRNFNLSEIICNRIPDVYFFCLKFLEADFLPHYLITRKYIKDPEGLHIICSGDKDLYQSLIYDNVVMIYKLKGMKHIITKNNMISTYVKLNKASEKTRNKKLPILSQIDPTYITAMMSVVGDTGDDIRGIGGIGRIRALDMFKDIDIVKKLIGDSNELNDRICNGGRFAKEDKIGLSRLSPVWKKILIENDIVVNAYKLISFESLCRWIEKKDTTEKCGYFDYLESILNKVNTPQIYNSNVLMQSLNSLEDNRLTEEVTQFLFVKK